MNVRRTYVDGRYGQLHVRIAGQAPHALAPGEFDVMGYHTGSKIAVELARQRPAQVRHLVLMSTPVYTDDDLAASDVTGAIARPSAIPIRKTSST
ncbi:MAG: hypothetical protein KF790_04895 [Steroidobacteraceae bacterium]|nr:hypothetical protein [Steroidobacteraceae bacterium]